MLIIVMMTVTVMVIMVILLIVCLRLVVTQLVIPYNGFFVHYLVPVIIAVLLSTLDFISSMGLRARTFQLFSDLGKSLNKLGTRIFKILEMLQVETIQKQLSLVENLVSS